MTIGQRIQQTRKAMGLSQKELGEKLGVSGSMVGQYENDLRNPKSDTLQRIAEALSVDVNWLRTGREKNDKSEDRVNAEEGFLLLLNFLDGSPEEQAQDLKNIKVLQKILDYLSEMDEEEADSATIIANSVICSQLFKVITEHNREGLDALRRRYYQWKMLNQKYEDFFKKFHQLNPKYQKEVENYINYLFWKQNNRL